MNEIPALVVALFSISTAAIFVGLLPRLYSLQLEKQDLGGLGPRKVSSDSVEYEVPVPYSFTLYPGQFKTVTMPFVLSGSKHVWYLVLPDTKGAVLIKPTIAQPGRHLVVEVVNVGIHEAVFTARDPFLKLVGVHAVHDKD